MRGDERRLAEALLVDAQRVQQLVVDDGVVHAHAAFVEDAHDGLVLLQLGGQGAPQLRLRLAGSADRSRSRTWRRVVGDRATRAATASIARAGELVGEVLAPDRAVGDARLGQRGVQVEQPDEPGPLAAPVGDGQDRAAMGAQAGQHVVAVLPDGLGHDDRRVRVDARRRRPCPCAGSR